MVVIQRIADAGESETVEFKKSTAQLSRAGETLCAFLNAQGGRVLIGVTSDGKVAGQHVSDSTLRDIAATFDRFEPPARIEIDRIPLGGGKEVVVLHRDYAITGGSVGVAIYDDRLEIWSDGTLPFGLKVEDLKRNHRSLLRNQFIADAFYRRRLVERWGLGTQMIVNLCVRAGHPEPEFVEESGAVGVRFLPSGYIAPHRVVHDLTDRQREILQLLAGALQLTFAEIRKGLKEAPSDRSIRNDLMHLRRLGLTRLDGRGRGARWSLMEAVDE